MIICAMEPNFERVRNVDADASYSLPIVKNYRYFVKIRV
jgi:hypothetical protein